VHPAHARLPLKPSRELERRRRVGPHAQLEGLAQPKRG